MSFLGVHCDFRVRTLALVLACVLLGPHARGAKTSSPHRHTALANVDKRHSQPDEALLAPEQRAKGLSRLAQLVPDVRVDFDPISGSPKWIGTSRGFLSGANGVGKAIPAEAHRGLAAADRHKSVRAFLNEHSALFGYDSTALNNARVVREYTAAHNGLHTTVWQQEVDGIPVFEAVFIAHITRAGELVNISSQFVPTAGNRKGRSNNNVSSRRAVYLAARDIEEVLAEEDVAPNAFPRGRPGSDHFSARQLRGDVDVQRSWLWIDKSLRLCWDVILSGTTHREMYRVLVDADSGEVLLRHCLTSDISNASYRVYTSDSPSPWSPGPSTVSTVQPPLVSRTLVVTNAVSTNASPNGWINDGDNETRGNNVDAHLDRDGNNVPDLPRPQGSPSRVFDFPLDLTQQPIAYGNAAVVNLFYWCNWYHDKLYELGFTESAGNFQSNNFGRGGLGGDPVIADAQDGSGVNNETFTTPPDGMSPRMEVYLMSGAPTNRDGCLDTEVMLHECTHGLSWRRVGGGVGTTLAQSRALAEGWSDFYALALLSEPSDDVHGNYAFGAYLGYLLGGTQMDNYYFGVRRYPYTTDLGRNPLTFRDIDSSQASPHTGIPISSVVQSVTLAGEPHNAGEVWCVSLWEARANVIDRLGFAIGNQTILQIVTDAMSLSPPNPNFVQARDAVIQADLVNNNGANFHELWAAFAKRGLGDSATAPASTSIVGVHEAFDLPDDMVVVQKADVIATGPAGGPFVPDGYAYTLLNLHNGAISWTAVNSDNWLTISNANGAIVAGGSVPVVVSLNNKATLLPEGIYTNSIIFSNQLSGRTQVRQVVLRVGQLDYFTESFNNSDNDLSFKSFTFYPDGSRSFYSVCQEPATTFFADPRQGKTVSLNALPGKTADDNYAVITLSGGATVSLYGRSTNVFFIGSNGYLTFGEGTNSFAPLLSEHFRLRRVAGLLQDLDPTRGGRVSWQQQADKVVVTFEKISQFFQQLPIKDTNSFQFELFYDGRIRLTYLQMDAQNGIVGLSGGNGVPPAFLESDFTSYGFCAARLALVLPEAVAEGDGVLSDLGQVSIPTAIATNLTVALRSTDTSELVVPPGVIIPAGETEAFFDLTILDDGILDGTQAATVVATAPQYISGSGTTSIRDNESTTLSLTLPNSVAETAGTISGTLSVIGVVGSGVTVALISSDPSRISVPSTVMLPAGSSSISLPLTIIDNGRIEGTQSVTITAEVENWTSAQTSVLVTDDESPELSLRLPTAFSESSGVLSGAGVVSVRGTVLSNVVLSLFSANEDKISVPPAVLLPAGQSNATFDLTAVNDFVADGNQPVTLMVMAAGFVSGEGTVTVLDDETPPAPANPMPAHLSTGRPVDLDLQWSVAEGELLQNGDFEEGTLGGWHQESDGSGSFILNDGTTDPTGPDGPLPPFAGQFSALSSEPTAGRISLYQDITIPPGASRVTLSWRDRIRNHAGAFSANQQFRVELRDVNGTVLALPFVTRPGDPLQSDWTERTFDLTSFRGQTLRLAFVQIESAGFLNVHLDNVSVVATSPEPITFAVYMDTSGGTQLLGTTTNRFWHLSNLLPETTYFWRVVSLRVGQSSGPVWQFTTLGIDHFEISQLPGSKTAGEPFDVTVRAKNAAGVTVANFNGFAHLSALFGPAPVPVFAEDFEGAKLEGWVTNSTFALTDSTAFEGKRALLLSGGSGQPSAGVQRPLPATKPTRVKFSARAPTSTSAGGAFMLGSGPSPGNAVTLFAFSQGGTMGISDSSGGAYFIPYQSNRWYQITLDIDWHNKAVDFYVDDTLVEQGAPFRGTNVTDVTALYLFNQSNTSSLWDDIELLSLSGLDPLAVNPPTITNFVNGQWTGQVLLNQAQLGVRLKARDDTGHFGISSSFDLLLPGDVSLDVSASSNPLLTEDELTYNIRVFNAGPFQATGISLQSIWSRPPAVLSAGFAGGSCLVTESNVICDLPALPAGASKMVSIVVASSEIGPLTNVCTLTRAGQDAMEENNSFRTITEVIPPTSVAIEDSSLIEGDVGVTNAVFQVRLAAPSAYPVTVYYNTAAGTADSGFDFVPTNASLVFMPGLTNRTISIPVLNDTLRESNETFFVQLVGVQNAFILDNRATGLIFDNDPLVNISIEDSIGTEPVSGGAQMTFRVTLSQPSGVPVQVGYSTSGGSAASGSDFVGATGTILIPPGETNGSIAITINSDGVFEANESFFLNLSNPVNGIISRSQAVGLIIDRDAPPCVTVEDTSLVETDSAGASALFRVSLSRSNQQPVFVSFATADGTAIAGEDYSSVNSFITFAPGVVTQFISVPITGDNRCELDEVFFLSLTGATNGSICRAQATGRILDNDPLPGLSVMPLTMSEGNLGFTTGLVQISLSPSSGRTVSVEFATDDGSALAGFDYISTNGTVTFPPGVTTKLVPIAVRGDSLVEASETLFFHLIQPVNAILQTPSAAVTIVDDDGAAGILNHFDWSITPSPQTMGASFPVSLTARDVFGSLVSNFNGTVSISGRLTAADIAVGQGNASFVHPVGAFFRAARAQVLYLSSELGSARDLTGLALEIVNPPGQALANWTIRLKHTSSVSAPGAWETAGWTTVYQADQVALSNGWVSFPFTAPFAYNGSNNLLVDFSFNNSSYSFDGQCRSSEAPQPRTLAASSDGAAGDPLGWNGSNSPPGVLYSQIPNVRFSSLSLPLSVQPATAGPFNSGVWNGNLQVQAAGTDIYLWADDHNGHFGAGNTFTVFGPNSEPRFNPISNQLVDEQTLLSFPITGSDNETPANQLIFSLLPNVPAGASISSSGLFQWQPSESQGPGSYTISVRVTDTGNPPRSADTNFMVTVREVNQPPAFIGPAARVVNAGNLISFSTAADADLPAQTLFFSLGPGAPAGVSLNSSSGLFSWTPSEAQVGDRAVTVNVSDNGTPALSSMRTYSIHVLPSSFTGVMVFIARRDNAVDIVWSAQPGRTYRVLYKHALDDPEWGSLSGDVTATGTSATKVDPLGFTQQRFYQIFLLP